MAAAASRPTTARAGFTLLALATVVAVAACSASTPSASTTAATSAPPSAASASPVESPAESPAASPSAAPSSGASGVPTAIDPCTLVTASEASKLAGATFGAGKESTSGDTRICAYGASTPNVFEVLVAQAPDVATAKAAEQEAENLLQGKASQLASKGFVVTQLPGFAPGVDAVLLEDTMSVSGLTIGGRAIYLLKGTVFTGFSDIVLNGAPPSADAMKAQAMTLIGRLP